MQKYNLITIVVLVLLMGGITSCKKGFLEIVPKGNLVAKTYDDYNRLMNSANFYVFNNNGEWQAAMIMGDDVSAEENVFTGSSLAQAVALFKYDNDIFLPSNDPESSSERPAFVGQLLQNLYGFNKIIIEAGASSGGTAQQKQDLIAQAMAARAFANFQLINYFAKPYSAASASTDPGFPIITTADITATDFKRGTVQEMYDFIIKDLGSAVAGLNTQSPFPTRWSKPAAEAFLGKVYLWMGKNTEALAMFNAAFADMAKMGRPPRLYDYNQTFAPDGAFLPIDPVSGPNAPLNNITDQTESLVAIFSYAGTNDGQNFGNDFLTIAPKTMETYDPADLRLNFFTNLQQDQTPVAGGRVRRYTVQYSYSSYARIGLELPELYLLRAEAKARANDLSGAKADVETLRQHRMPVANATVPSAIAGNQVALIKFILEERTREYAGLGYRWWDMRRLSADALFQGQALSPHTLYLTNGGTQEFPLRKERLTLRIPRIYLAGHPDMVDNP